MTTAEWAKIFGVASAHGWPFEKTMDYLRAKYGRRAEDLTAKEVDDVCEHIHLSSPCERSHS